MIQHLAELLHYVLPFLIVISVIVFVHEFGHYWVARMCGVRIEEFSIGFGHKIFGWKDKHGTEWKVCWLPMGGYVKMFGDAGAASTPDDAVHAMTAEEKKVAFFHQNVFKRIAIVAAGPAFNYIFAIAVLTLLFMKPPFDLPTSFLCHSRADSTTPAALNNTLPADEDCFLFQGQHYTPPVVGGLPPTVGAVVPHTAAADAGFQEGDRILTVNGNQVEHNDEGKQVLTAAADAKEIKIEIDRKGDTKTLAVTPEQLAALNELLHQNVAAVAGVRTGDRITAIDGSPIERFEQVKLSVMLNSGTAIDMSVNRNGATQHISVTPEIVATVDRFGGEHKIGRLGIMAHGIEYKRWPFFTAIGHASMEVWDISLSTLRGVGQMIIGTRGTEELGGPLRIAQMSGHVADDGAAALILFMAMISVNLGLVNLFPVPLLDGGHIFFYLAEAVRGKPLHQKFLDFGFRVGMVLIFSLMVFATWNDFVQMGFITFLRHRFMS